MMRNSGLVQVDDLTGTASWETGDCLVIRFDPQLLSKEQLHLLLRMRDKREHVAVQFPLHKKERGHIVGFDQQDFAIYLAMIEKT